MRKRDFDRLMSWLGTASPAQLRVAESRLSELNASKAALLMADQRMEHSSACLYCGTTGIQRWGRTTAGVQRFRCSGCNKTFSALTGTPFSRLHGKAKLLENAACMREFLSIRKTARRLGVHRNTAFRYRHIMLPHLAKHQPTTLDGVTEADEMFFRRSYKGQKAGLPRPPHRGSPAKKRGLSKEQVPVFTALSRGSRQSLIEVLPAPVNAIQIESILRPVLKSDAVLCSDSASAYKTAAKSLGIHVRQIPRGSHKLGPYHIQNANALHSRVKGRMRAFQGVATRYLPGYLAWVRFFDRDDGLESARSFLLDAFDLPTPVAAVL